MCTKAPGIVYIRSRTELRQMTGYLEFSGGYFDDFMFCESPPQLMSELTDVAVAAS